MKNVVMLPIYNREAFLTITLELLGKNKEHQDHYYLFVLDIGYRSGVRDIAQKWLNNHDGEIYRIDATQARSPIKQSYAIFKGYERALQLTRELVFMVEDDIFTSNRFFEWHYKILEKTGAPLSIATKQRDLPYPLVKDFQGYFQKPDYQSLGVCWTKTALQDALKLFRPEYWHNPFAYVNQIYPQVKREFVASQDGILHKHIIANNIPVAWPIYPRAWHGGYAGLNRKLKRATGSIPQKMAQIRQVAFNEAALKAELKRQNAPMDYFYDSIPVDQIQPEIPLPRLELRSLV